jgi:hypothetical protein
MATTVDYILKVSADQARAALKTLNQQTDKLGTGFQKTMKKMGASMLKLSAGIAASGAAIIAFGQKMADLANQMSDASTKTGLTTDTLQGLKLAAEGSGLSFSNLENGLVRFQSSIAQAVEGTGRSADAFKALGIDVHNSQGELKSADQLFTQVTNRLGELENITMRNSLAMDLFGQRAGPALAQSGALQNMKAFKEFASEFGVNMKDAGEEAARFQRAMAEIKLVLEGVFSGLLMTATGTTKLSDGLFAVADNIIFFGTIADSVLGNVRAFITGLITGFEAVIETIGNMGNVLLNVMTFNFAEAKRIAEEAGDFASIQFEKMIDELTTGLVSSDAMIRKADEAVEKQRELRKAILEGGITAPTQAARPKGQAAKDFTGVTGRMEKFSIELDQFTNDLFESTEKLLKGIENLPMLVEKAFRVSVAGVITESIIAGVSGPSGFLNTIGEAFDTLTMGLSSTIAGAIGGIARLGEKTPKEIQQDFQNFAKAFEKGLRMLPRVLIQVLPRFVVALIRGIGEAILKLPAILIDAFGEAFTRLWESIKEFFKSIFTREGRAERRRDRRNRRRSRERFFENLGESSQFFMSGGIMQAQSGARFTGAKRGLAMLHEGETVLPASGRAGQAEQRMMNKAGGGGINIVINSAVVENRAIDELVRKLETRFGQFGVGKSSLFGR